MATLTAIRDALAAALGSVEGLRAYAGWPGQVNPPAAVVSRRSSTFDTSMSGTTDHTFLIRVMVSWAAGAEIAQERLDAYLAPAGASSVRAAIAADPTLGGVVDDAAVTSVEADQVVEFPPGSGLQYLSANLVVEVL